MMDNGKKSKKGFGRREAFRIGLYGSEKFVAVVKGYMPEAPHLEVRSISRKNFSQLLDGQFNFYIIESELYSEICRIENFALEDSSFIVVGEKDDVRAAVEWIKAGACDYFSISNDKGAISEAAAKEYESWLKKIDELSRNFILSDRFIGSGPFAGDLSRTIKKVAKLPGLTVLLQGETGTGKGLAARLIHRYSESEGELVEINCAAIPEQLLESELLGYEAGSFTDARQRKIGLLELAEKGSVLLDEIGCMPYELQAKILKCIEEKKFRRIGGQHELKFNARIIASTNSDLPEMVKRGKFRKDLYYRLNVFPIKMKALRERQEDIFPLAEHFLQYFNKIYGLKVKGITENALRGLEKYEWPGNVRELKHKTERAVILREEGMLQPGDFGWDDEPGGNNGQKTIRIMLGPEGIRFEDAEREVIRQTLVLAKGNRSRAARMLEMPRSRLLRMIDKHNLKEEGKNDSNKEWG